jgi:hypothetical protein
MKTKALLALVLSLNLMMGLSGCDDAGLNIHLSEAQIESQMTGYFPYHKETLMGQLQFDLQQPDLILKDNSDRAELLLQTKITTLGQAFPFQMRLSFGLDYDVKTGTIYLIDPRLADQSLVNIPVEISSNFTKYLLPMVQQYLARVPVYTFKPESSDTQNIARKTLKKLQIKDKGLLITMGIVGQP